MYEYIEGIIKDIKPNYIVIDNNGIGYKVFTPNPFVFKIDEAYHLYLYQHIREEEMSLFGFKSTDEKSLFLRLIEVKGVGPKTALPMLATGSVNGIIDAIERENILYLRKFPKIGEKVAKQIILDLKGKLVTGVENIVEQGSDELVEALKALGYKTQDISKIIPKINLNAPIGDQIKEALRLFLK